MICIFCKQEARFELDGKTVVDISTGVGNNCTELVHLDCLKKANGSNPKDSTASTRQYRRRRLWSDAIKAAGWVGESQFVTAVINGRVELPKQKSDH